MRSKDKVIQQLALQVAECKKGCQSLNAATAKLQEVKDQYQQANSLFGKEKTALREQLLALRKELSERRQEAVRLESEYSGALKAEKTVKEEASFVNQHWQLAKDQHFIVQRRHRERLDEIEKKQAQVLRLRSSCSSLRSELEEVAQLIAEADATALQLEQKVDEPQVRNQQLRDELSEVEQRLAELYSQSERLEDLYFESQAEANELLQEVDILGQEIGLIKQLTIQNRKEGQRCEAEAGSRQELAEVNRARVVVLQKQLAEVEEEAQRTEGEKADLAAQVEEQEERVEALRCDLSKVQQLRQLYHSQNEALRGCLAAMRKTDRQVVKLLAAREQAKQ